MGWDDIQALLNTSFTTEEKRLVLERAREENESQNSSGGPEQYTPKAEPEWDPSISAEIAMIKQYQELILNGVQHSVPRPKNLSKLYEVRQEGGENPSAFNERLCENARKWTDSDSED